MKPIVLLGGEVHRPKLDRLRAQSELAIEWAPMSAVQTVVRRVKARDVAAVILLNGLVHHSGVGSLMRAVRLHNVPLAYAARAGRASLERAFDQLRRVLGAGAVIGTV